MSFATKFDAMELFSEVTNDWNIIFGAANDAFVFADKDGVIRYLNSAFSKITKLKPEDRLGANIYELSPDCALAECLRSKTPVWGHVTKIPETTAETVANAVPIYRYGELVGAVEWFQSNTGTSVLANQLSSYQKELERIKLQIGHLFHDVYCFEYIIGNNKGFREAVKQAKMVADSNSHILLQGEWGTGKQLLARSIHRASSRASYPIVVIDCCESPGTMLDLDLFGYKDINKLTGDNYCSGKFELTSGGTIFLKEVSCLDKNLQDRLTYFLQSGQTFTCENDRVMHADIRIIASSSQDLRSLVQKGQFKEELFHRLSMVEINLPPLRERKDDIELLTNHFVSKLCRRFGKKLKGINPHDKAKLTTYQWPGNLNELENVLAKTIMSSMGEFMDELSIGEVGVSEAVGDNIIMANKILTFDEMEQILLSRALAKFGDTVDGKKQAAQALNISLATLYNKLKKYQCKK